MENTVAQREIRPVSDAWAVLKKMGWFAGLNPGLQSELRKTAKVRDFDPGQALYHAGDKPNGIFGLVSGALDISIPRADGQDLTVHRADPGFWVGDLAFLAQQVRLVSVRAALHSQVVQLPQAKLNQLIKQRPEIIADLYALTYRNTATTLQLLGNLSVSPSEIRIGLRLLQQEDQLPANKQWIQISHETLSELVALSMPTLQRVLRKLESSGLIELGYRRIRITDRVGLLALCGDVAASAALG